MSPSLLLSSECPASGGCLALVWQEADEKDKEELCGGAAPPAAKQVNGFAIGPDRDERGLAKVFGGLPSRKEACEDAGWQRQIGESFGEQSESH